jgi:5'(3')-deoxyribonucleotidase
MKNEYKKKISSVGSSWEDVRKELFTPEELAESGKRVEKMSKKQILKKTKKIIYIDMDDVLCDYQEGKNLYFKIYPEILYPQSIRGFFENLKPIKDGVETVKKMINSDIYDPYILTAPSVKNPHSYTEKRIWIEKYFGYEFTKKLIICSNKGLLKGDILIDDHIEGRGQENFQGLVFHFGSTFFKNWQIIDKKLFK